MRIGHPDARLLGEPQSNGSDRVARHAKPSIRIPLGGDQVIFEIAHDDIQTASRRPPRPPGRITNDIQSLKSTTTPATQPSALHNSYTAEEFLACCAQACQNDETLSAWANHFKVHLPDVHRIGDSRQRTLMAHMAQVYLEYAGYTPDIRRRLAQFVSEEFTRMYASFRPDERWIPIANAMQAVRSKTARAATDTPLLAQAMAEVANAAKMAPATGLNVMLAHICNAQHEGLIEHAELMHVGRQVIDHLPRALALPRNIHLRPDDSGIPVDPMHDLVFELSTHLLHHLTGETKLIESRHRLILAVQANLDRYLARWSPANRPRIGGMMRKLISDATPCA